jgi:hypothetical protein
MLSNMLKPTVLNLNPHTHTQLLMEHANMLKPKSNSPTQDTLMLHKTMKLLYKLLLPFNQFQLPLKLINQSSNYILQVLSHHQNAEHHLTTVS